MKKPRKFIIVTFIISFLCISLITSKNSFTLSSLARTGATFNVTAGETSLAINTPIIIDANELPFNQTQLATSIVYSDSTALPTQADDLNNDGIIDEIVFQLPTAISSSSSKTFTIYANDTGTGNGQNPNSNLQITQGLYNETYSNILPSIFSTSFNASNNESILAPAVNRVGDVIWIETDWAILCLYVSAAWKHSSWRHIILTGEDWDLVTGSTFNATSDWKWEWSRFMYEGDYGWHSNINTSDTISIAKIGSVRAVIQTISGIGYKGINGIAEGINATRTFFIYSGISGIAQNLRLTGTDAVSASQNMTNLYGVPLEFNTKFIDFGLNSSINPWALINVSNNFNHIYSPSMPNIAGNDSRYQSNLIYREFNLSKITHPYFGMYNDQNEGFVVYWGNIPPANLLGIYWDEGEIDVKYSFNQFPLTGINRILIPFKASGTVTDYIDSLYSKWLSNYEIQSVSLITDSDTTSPTDTTSSTDTTTSTSDTSSTEKSGNFTSDDFFSSFSEYTIPVVVAGIVLITIFSFYNFILRKRSQKAPKHRPEITKKSITQTKELIAHLDEKTLHQRRVDTLQKFARKVKRMAIKDMAERLEFESSNQLMDYILDLPDDSPFKIDGSDVVIEFEDKSQEEIQTEIDKLLNQFDKRDAIDEYK
ncbi:MAG: DUF4861 family protein [Candidatus Hodarchaeales archaeon]|jgi:hypothetical protein